MQWLNKTAHQYPDLSIILIPEWENGERLKNAQLKKW